METLSLPQPLLGILLAGLGDVIGILIPIVAVLFWVLNQIFGGEAAKQQQQRRMQRPRPQAAVQPRRPQQPAAAQVDDEVAQFLQRAAQKRGGQPAADVEVVRPQAARPQPRRLRPAEQTIAKAEVVENPRQARPLAPPAKPRLASRPDASLPEALAPVDQADEKLEEHLHSVFDHRLGSLDTTRPDTTRQQIAETPLAAAGFAALLSNPLGARQAIILSEILKRPEDRW